MGANAALKAAQDIDERLDGHRISLLVFFDYNWGAARYDGRWDLTRSEKPARNTQDPHIPANVDTALHVVSTGQMVLSQTTVGGVTTTVRVPIRQHTRQVWYYDLVEDETIAELKERFGMAGLVNTSGCCTSEKGFLTGSTRKQFYPGSHLELGADEQYANSFYDRHLA